MELGIRIVRSTASAKTTVLSRQAAPEAVHVARLMIKMAKAIMLVNNSLFSMLPKEGRKFAIAVQMNTELLSLAS
ncbi:hypothetical protein Leryth_001649 [Lithospermum erythrorhizon]|nr:hypothetical protein Leryth_001649 [Lithospermum erythrorhizon]